MIKNNRIIFGFGTISVGSEFGTIEFTEISPPQEIGENININNKNIEYFRTIRIDLNSEEYYELLKELDTISLKENKEIKFKNYILDFNEYNEKSVGVVKRHAYKSQIYSIIAYAC